MKLQTEGDLAYVSIKAGIGGKQVTKDPPNLIGSCGIKSYLCTFLSKLHKTLFLYANNEATDRKQISLP